MKLQKQIFFMVSVLLVSQSTWSMMRRTTRKLGVSTAQKFKSAQDKLASAQVEKEIAELQFDNAVESNKGVRNAQERLQQATRNQRLAQAALDQAKLAAQQELKSNYEQFQRGQHRAQKVLDMAPVKPFLPEGVPASEFEAKPRSRFWSRGVKAAGVGAVGVGGAAYGVSRMLGQQSDEEMIARAAQRHGVPAEALVVRTHPETGQRVVARIW